MAGQGMFLVVQISVTSPGIHIPSTLVPAKKHMNNAVRGGGKIKCRKEVTMSIL